MTRVMTRLGIAGFSLNAPLVFAAADKKAETTEALLGAAIHLADRQIKERLTAAAEGA